MEYIRKGSKTEINQITIVLRGGFRISEKGSESGVNIGGGANPSVLFLKQGV